jgi:hypothetical protein
MPRSSPSQRLAGRRRRPAFEALEGRDLPSASTPFAFGIASPDGSATATAVATDPAGDIYITGSFGGTVDFDPGPGVVRLSAGGPEKLLNDAFVAKYAPSGRLLWARQLGGTDDAAGVGLAVDRFGDVVVAGQFRGTLDADPGPGTFDLVGPTGAISLGPGAGSLMRGVSPNLVYLPDNAFVVKLDGRGRFAWAHSVQPADSGIGSVAVDRAGNVYVSGGHQGTADFGPGLTLSGDGGFLARYDRSGRPAWAEPFPAPPGASVTPLSLAVDAAGRLIAAGHFFAAASGRDDAFVAALDAGGHLLGVADLPGTPGRSITSVAVDRNDHVYAAGMKEVAVFAPDAPPGTPTPDLFLSKYDATGRLAWDRTLPVASDGDVATFRGLAVDGTGHVVATGSFEGTLDADPGPGVAALTSVGSDDAFVLRLDAAGHFAGARRFGGTGNDRGAAVATAGVGRAVLVGGYGPAPIAIGRATLPPVTAPTDVFFFGAGLFAAAFPGDWLARPDTGGAKR